MPLKIAMIGAGSLGFTRRLVSDILAVPEFSDTRFAFMDISKKNLGMVAKIVARDIEHNKLPASIESTTDQKQAIQDADYVICTIRHGGLEAFRDDIMIPLKFGVDQCVGDTLSAGGIMYGQRHIPVILDICKDIRERSHDALLLNYANPMAMNTWAALKYGGVRMLGLCHGVQGSHYLIAEALGKKPEDIDYIAAGINHQTWFIKVDYKGRSMLDKLLPALQKHPQFSKTEKCRIDMLKRFGYWSTESNGHLSEYLPWYRKRPNEIRKWIDLSRWILGETGGYLRVCTEGRHWFETEFPKLMKEPPREYGDRSHEHGSFIIEALQTGRTYRGHFNVLNRNIITNLPNGCVVEVPGYVDRTGIHTPVIGDLPIQLAGVLRKSISVQELSVQAAVSGDINLLRQAMMLDPLVGAVCDPDQIWQMTDEMLVAQAKWLPQYKKHIPAARKRVRSEKRLYRPAKGVWVKSQVFGDMYKILDDAGKGKRVQKKKSKKAASKKS